MSYYRNDEISLVGGLVLVTVSAIARFMIVKPALFALIIVGICIPAIFIAKFLLNRDNKKSISDVPIYFIKNDNTIANTHCTVRFFANDKIIVMDNVADTNNKKRMFTIQLKNKYRLNRYWADICRIFDDTSSVDTLAPFLDIPKDCIILIDTGNRNTKFNSAKPQKINIDNSNVGPKFVDMNKVTPDKFGQIPNSYSKKSEEFVNLNSLSEQTQTSQQKTDETANLVEFSDTLQADSKKIEVNLVSAAELSVLPGINIVKAKKIIEYRNTNGYFKTVEEFIAAAEVKDYFAQKIKKLIRISIPKNNGNDEENEGRIVDF